MRPTQVKHPTPTVSTASHSRPCLTPCAARLQAETRTRGIVIAFVIAFATLVVANPAAALSISILSVTTDARGGDLAIGDHVTLEFGISNSGGAVHAVGISIYGYDRDVVEPVRVDTPASFLNDTLTIDGRSFGGFANHANPKAGRSLPGEIERIVREATPPRVGLFQGISLEPVDGDGSLDPGLDSSGATGLTGEGYAHARVTFRLIGAGPTTLWIGSAPNRDTVIRADGTLAPVPGLPYSIGLGPGVASSIRSALPIPEPGTALLIGLGLGLAGLARRTSPRNQFPRRPKPAKPALAALPDPPGLPLGSS